MTVMAHGGVLSGRMYNNKVMRVIMSSFMFHMSFGGGWVVIE